MSAVDLRSRLAPITISPHHCGATFRNWGRSVLCTPFSVFQPTTEDECALVIQLARLEGHSVRPVAGGHSPSDLPCTTGFMIRMDKLDKLLEVNRQQQHVVVQGGMILSTLHSHLDAHGLAMSNVGSISDQSISGCISTATHGSGLEFGCLSTQVIALYMLLADGSRVHCSRSENTDLFLATLCGLGATGIILRVTLQTERAFRLKETHEAMHIDKAIGQLETVFTEAEHTRMWWYPQTNRVRVDRANRCYEPAQPRFRVNWFYDVVLGYHLTLLLLFFGRFIPAFNYYATFLHSSETMLAPATTTDKSYKVFNLDCLIPHHTTEWCVPFSEARATLLEIKEWLDQEDASPHRLGPDFPIEIRVSKEDDIWLSPAYGQISCWIGIVRYKPYGFSVPYKPLFKRFEQILQNHAGRPHWAKMHDFTPDALRKHYPKFDDYLRVLNAVDPHGLFRNEYVRRHIFGETGPHADKELFLMDT
ncbi:hypothetical protein BS47DRAFT_1488540 [Hydnum rufescens UP504]|uniref:D-arabinono-1,4-lactone oxidase n=1 Tax=Hydnum rufescens UP504 TaxID=1448309 RepID=A0A9P6DR35_9AGAM|nr:hypothetical protein BS47DRAFT_1488540 [Hydnum rufescens UP504]